MTYTHLSDQASAARAADLHRSAIVIDGHCDILVPLADGKIRLGEPIVLPDPATWEPPLGLMGGVTGDLAGMSPHSYYFSCAGQYSIPQLRAGGVTVQVCAIFLEDHQLERALQRGLEMAWWLHREVAENEGFKLITAVSDIHRLKETNQCGAILAFEGFEPLGFDLRFLDIFYQLGLRLASLTHNRRNQFADGWQPHIDLGGLTALGKQAIRRMNELGIVIDLGHMNQVGFWEIMELSTDPVVLSHTSVRKLFPARPEDSLWYPARDVSQGHERLRLLADKGGVVGIIFYGTEDIADVIADMEYALELIGPNHVALGSDFYGLDGAPKGLETIDKLPRLTEALVRRGHADETILKILGGNYLRVFEQVWK
jgi:membrane dipeptidase